MATSRLCSIPDCGKPMSCRTWCASHYSRWLRHGNPTAGRAAPDPTAICSVPDCGRPCLARGWCLIHYRHWQRYGNPLIRKRIANGEAQRYFDSVVLTFEGDECLIWPYGRSAEGYAKLKSKVVARLVCIEVNGPPPTAVHQAAHLCGRGNLGCVAKRHVEWKTPAANQADRLVHGTSNRGERSPSAKLTLRNVREIRRRHAAGTTQAALAREFHVTASHVSHICSGHVWLEDSPIGQAPGP